VLEDVGVNEAGHAHVKRAGAAAHDVDPELVEASFALAGNNSTHIFVETPCVDMGGTTFLGVLRLALAPAVARARSGLDRFKWVAFPRFILGRNNSCIRSVAGNGMTNPCTLGHLYSK
jgi:hypothetical protein